jgi:hypothetical protein
MHFAVENCSIRTYGDRIISFPHKIFHLKSMRRRKEHGGAIHAVPTACESACKAAKDSLSPANSGLSTEDVVALLILASGTLLGYTLTLYPSVAGGDSGELVAESCHLGVSHPPGYPLFNMAVHLFTRYLPFGETRAWKANFFSAGTS